jgi:uncharacterized peroxidase-related enzyme
LQGADKKTVQMLTKGKLAGAKLTIAERALLDYARLITQRPQVAKAADTQKLRRHGWSDEQIAEAVYIIAMFAFFNRVADAFGIPSMNYLKAGKVSE